MNISPSAQLHNRRGFTLIEVMLAVGLMSLLIGGIFAVQRGALSISRDVMEQQEKSMRMNSFVELMRRSFEQAPGNSKIHLIVPRGSDGSSEVFFKDYPLAFAWSGVSAGSKSVILRIERNAVRQYTAVVLYLDDEATKDYEAGNLDEDDADPNTGLPRVRRLELMEGIASLSWKVLDSSNASSASSPTRSGSSAAEDEWLDEWPLDKTKRPAMVKFALLMADGSEPLNLTFWIPTMANPEQFATGGGGVTPGGGSTGGGGATPIEVIPGIPGGNGRPPGIDGGRPPGGGGGRPDGVGGGRPDGGGGRPGGGGGRGGR